MAKRRKKHRPHAAEILEGKTAGEYITAVSNYCVVLRHMFNDAPCGFVLCDSECEAVVMMLQQIESGLGELWALANDFDKAHEQHEKADEKARAA